MRTLGICVLLGCLPLLAQTRPAATAPPPADEELTLKVDVDLVTVLCSVRTKQGGLVANLEKTDFTIFEDGQKQEIRYFARETNLPLTIGLLVDVSGSQRNLIGVEQQAAAQFFSQVVKDKDQAFLISFGMESELLQDFTNSVPLLRKGLNELRLSVPPSTNLAGPVPTASQPRGTVLYDAIFLAADERLKGEAGRKAIVVITDGEDQGSRLRLEEALAAAQKADSIIYGLYYVDPAFYSMRGFGEGGGLSVLRKMAGETGGRVIEVDRRLPLDAALRQISDELRSQYSIGYAPTNGTRDGRYRKLDVKMGNRDYRVQARKGYYAIKRTE